MSRAKAFILLSLAFLMITGIAFLGLREWPVEAARLTLQINKEKAASIPTATPTPNTGITPPDFPACPADFELLGTFEDHLRRDIEPRSHSYPFSLSWDGIVLLQGWVMEGHPDLGCPGHPDCDEIQDHEDIIFEIDGDVLGIYEDSEHGPEENAWFFFGPMFADLAAGEHLLTFRHTLHGEGAQSVGFRFSLCGPEAATPTPTFTAELTPSSTPTPSASPTDEPSATATSEPTATPTATAAQISGLVVFGKVQVDDSAPGQSRKGLAGVEIRLAFASYPGKVVAITDGEGSYISDFIAIPVDETIRIWAEKDGYRFEPSEEAWRFYVGYYQEREINFLAYADVVTPTSTPWPIGSDCEQPMPPPPPQGYFLFKDTGIYPTGGIFSHQAGTVSTWMCLQRSGYRDREDHVVFHTSDSRVVLYVDTYFSEGMQSAIFRIVARAGGTHRAVDSGYAAGNFPEASIIVDNDGGLSSYKHEWYSPVPFPEGEWHLVTMTWDGYPTGVVKIFLDENLIGQKPYDERYNDERPLADSIAVGFRPGGWPGEIYQGETGRVEGQPRYMVLEEGGIMISDLRLYQKVLSQQEVSEVYHQGLFMHKR